MEKPEELESCGFRLAKKHIQLLESINDGNKGLALRTLLNSVINGKEQQARKEQRDGIINFVSFGLLFFFLSYLISNVFITLLCIMLGVFLFGYGIMGGVVNALQRTRYK